MNAGTTTAAGLAMAATLLLGQGVRADEWDSASAGDVGIFTSNVLLHGTAQVHDVATVGGTPDQDWYRLNLRPMSSYEMVVDGQTGDLVLLADDFQRLAQTGVVLQTATQIDQGYNLSLAWQQDANADTQLVRVKGAACDATGCSFNDRYRIRFYETTYTIPRFNNTSTQTTVLLVQNNTDRSCDVHFYLLSGAGVVETSTVIPGFKARVINTAQVAPNRSGSVRVTHDCGYGALTGKAVAVEPATGFTFDTSMQHRAN